MLTIHYDILTSIIIKFQLHKLYWKKVFYMNINESAENYLETILILSKNLPAVRSIDVVNELNFKKSSVSVAMKNLREKEYIIMTDEGHIFLTEEGKKIANVVYEKHTLLSSLLEFLGVDSKLAAEDACRIEHVISNESFEAIKKYVKENI